MIAICVKANDWFTLFDEYEIMFHPDGLTVMNDFGTGWFVSYQGDGYYGCRDSDGKEVIFLVE